MNARDFERNAETDLMPSLEETSPCASVKGWEEDDFAQWGAGHRDDLKNAICNTNEYRESGDSGLH